MYGHPILQAPVMHKPSSKQIFKPSEAKTRDQLRKRIIELGRRFERIGKNNDNFDDTYFLTYKGPSN